VIIEQKVGGRWYETGEDGTECQWGSVLICEPPKRIVMTWQLNGNFEIETSNATEVEVNFVADGEGTQVTLEHRFFERFETGQQLRDSVGSDNGWSGLLKAFGAKIEAPTEKPLRHFVCKLITPRPTFMSDMSPEEGAALGSHVAYWTGLVNDKRVTLFGPVGDPAGVWGLGILLATDEKEALRIANDDPVISSGFGFRCEVFPMLRAVVGSLT
jgi:hypothetical protein